MCKQLGKKPSLSTEKRAQIVTLTNSRLSVLHVEKKMKVGKTAVRNAVMKYQMKVFQGQQRSADLQFSAKEKTALCIRCFVTLQ